MLARGSNLDLTHNQLDVESGLGSRQDSIESGNEQEPGAEYIRELYSAKTDAALAVLDVFAQIPDLRTLYLKVRSSANI